MKQLNSKQLEFLKNELGIKKVDYNDRKQMMEIREKCFDIETDETIDRLEAGIDEVSIGERGDMAVSIIDDLEEILDAS